ncbi:MAG TPA: efflux RND transporter periplasmic adaptor subunit [Bryobacteraceae bacterium]|nr:efflux RND transporter periplasmic adaptor subunit [Bryobacteraceae bacterium]
MKRKWKVLIGVFVVLFLAAGVVASVKYNRRGVVTVQTAKVVREDLSSVVTASGEIKPRNYINIGAEFQGQLTQILVKEGDVVKKGQLVAQIDETQSEADVAAQKAALSSSEADASASEAGYTAGNDNVTALQATLEHNKADLDRYEQDYKRAQQLLAQGLIAKQDFEQRKAAYDGQQAAVQEAASRIVQAKAQLAQLKAQLVGSQRKIAQNEATLNRVNDILKKHNVIAPIDGLVTYLPVRQGETVVPGVQNSAASTIMTIADMSIVTAEVKVDESDIVNIKLGQPAEISIDAIPNRTFTGRVSEIGNTAILRSTGLAASQSTTSSQEAKDFKVVVAMDIPPDEIRPGLSATTKITTATRRNALSIPIQALTTRTKGDLDTRPNKPVNPDPATVKANAEELTGVFVVTADRKAPFREVKTGISGSSDTEVLSGLTEGEEIVTGPYQVIRTIKNGAIVKVDNKPPKPKTTT